MPIISIISQPATNSLNAAYRPVVFQVRASNTDNTAIPPVVYCDIYFNGTFYKTIDKTQYKVLNSTDSDWQFDIQDACQEIFNKIIGLYGGSSIIKLEELLVQAYCKFRSSGYNAGGFITAENTAPVQGTGTVSPASGTGTQSNSFYLLNTALQHQHNQDLPVHLGYFKNGTWQNVAYPLSHRQNKYLLGFTGNDYFPFVYLGAKAMQCIKISYKRKGDTSYQTSQNCSVSITGGSSAPGGPACVGATIGGGQTLHDAQTGVAYSATINLSGTAPFSISSVVKPSWMTVTLSGSTITFTGTPSATGSVTISFTIGNCSGANTLNFSQGITVTDPPYRFGTSTNITGDATFEQETENLIGPPGGIATITVTTYTVTNSAGQVRVNGSQVFLNNTFDITLDGTGNGSFVAKVQGDDTDTGTVVRAIFTITSVTGGGTIGTPSTKQISKVF